MKLLSLFAMLMATSAVGQTALTEREARALFPSPLLAGGAELRLRSAAGVRLPDGKRIAAALLSPAPGSPTPHPTGALVLEEPCEISGGRLPAGNFLWTLEGESVRILTMEGKRAAGSRLLRDTSPPPRGLVVRKHGGVRVHEGGRHFVLWPMAGAPQDGGFTSIFNGVDLQGWRMAGAGEFHVSDGTLTSSGGMGMLWYEKEAFGDFILQLEWKVDSPAANSGVFLRIPERSDDVWFAPNHSYELQIKDDGAPESRTGAFSNLVASTKLASRPAGEWNTFHISVMGQSYCILLNGELVLDFSGHRALQGYIGLQNHQGSSVWFRNIGVRRLGAVQAGK